MECEHEIGPARAHQDAMRAGLALNGPANVKKGSKYPARLGGGLAAHAAWKETLRSSGTASPCSSRSASARSARAWTLATASGFVTPYARTPGIAATSAIQRPSDSCSISMLKVMAGIYNGRFMLANAMGL